MISIIAALSMPTAWAIPAPNVLVFSKTAAFRHDSIPAAIAAIKKMGEEKGFKVDATEDATLFTNDNLAKYDVVIFASTTGDVLNNQQQGALQRFVNQGKGWVGIHAAADTEYDWPWYGELVGAYFKSHPPGLKTTTVKIENRGHVSTVNSPENWTRSDEWYDWRANPRAKVQVLASIDDSTFRTEVLDHPVTWCKSQGRGRAWYTAMGHTKETYSEPAFLDQLYGGIMWAAQGAKPAKATSVIWQSLKGWSNLASFNSPPITNLGSVGTNLVSTQKFGDCHLHAEFKIPKGSNSGIYLQGRYEIQIFDSSGTANAKLQHSDCGGIYQRWTDGTNTGFEGKAPLVNAFSGADNWNTLDLVFRAPRFANGKKENAKFVEVRLNGILIHQNQEVSGPTRAAMFANEAATGPVMLQGDHGPIDVKNVWVKPLSLP
ncbi:MAG TPA: ThuA domain-containing protein [Fimbriimonas sp.]|nr:ThuA domain-containing protein [Fimbriimonas sp.]